MTEKQSNILKRIYPWGSLIIFVGGVIALIVLAGVMGLLPDVLGVYLGGKGDVIYGKELEGEYRAVETSVSNVSSPVVFPQPVLVVSDEFHNLGRVRPGERAEHAFIIRNNGAEVLRVEAIYTTCDYVTAHLTADEIPPGRAALLVLGVEPYHRVREPMTVRRGVILVTNDANHPEMEVWVQATIIP